MKTMLNTWRCGLSYLIFDDLISFYTFFTVIFAECAYLFAFCNLNTAIKFGAILISYVAIALLTAWIKGWFEGYHVYKYVPAIYLLSFVTIFLMGWFIEPVLCFILTIIPLIITAIWIVIRSFQDTIYIGDDKFRISINNIFSKKSIWILSQIFVIGTPFIAFTIFFACITYIPIALKIIIPIVYLVIAPYIAYAEDTLAACNIFELFWEM